MPASLDRRRQADRAGAAAASPGGLERPLHSTRSAPELPRVSYRPLQREDARAIAEWNYAPPHDAYVQPFRDPEQAAELLQPDAGYYALLSEADELVGYFCVGAGGRIAGGAYPGDGLDLGLALRPDLTGRGQGAGYVHAVMRLLARERSAEWIRVTIEIWNQRALRVCEGLGFRRLAAFGGFRRASAGDYVVLVRPARGL